MVFSKYSNDVKVETKISYFMRIDSKALRYLYHEEAENED